MRIQAKTAKYKNGENLKFMADSGSMQQSSKLADIATQYELLEQLAKIKAKCAARKLMSDEWSGIR
jgi:hypothetical protein